MLGVRFVDGTGDVIRNSGKVMKNVTGYDLVKLLCVGYVWCSHGAIFKVQPKPERAVTLLMDGLDLNDAVAVDCARLRMKCRVLPIYLETSRTLLRVEGFERQVDYRYAELAKLLKAPARMIEGKDHEALWREVRDVERFAGDENRSGGCRSSRPTRPCWPRHCVMAATLGSSSMRWRLG